MLVVGLFSKNCRKGGGTLIEPFLGQRNLDTFVIWMKFQTHFKLLEKIFAEMVNLKKAVKKTKIVSKLVSISDQISNGWMVSKTALKTILVKNWIEAKQIHQKRKRKDK